MLGLAAAGVLPEGVLKPEEVEEARELWRRAAETVDGAVAAPEVDRAVKAFVRRSLGERQPPAVWDDDELRSVRWRAGEAAWQGLDAPLPAGVGPKVLGGDRGEVRRFQAWQVGGRGTLRGER